MMMLQLAHCNSSGRGPKEHNFGRQNDILEELGICLLDESPPSRPAACARVWGATATLALSISIRSSCLLARHNHKCPSLLNLVAVSFSVMASLLPQYLDLMFAMIGLVASIGSLPAWRLGWVGLQYNIFSEVEYGIAYI